MSWYEDLPKVELHVHLEGAIPLPALLELIRKYDGDLSVSDISALEKRFEYRDFRQFIETWTWKNQFLLEYEDFTHVAELTARDFAAQNIRYAEVFFSPSLFLRQGLQVQEITRAIRKGLDRVPGIKIALIADLVRDYGPKSEMATLSKLSEVMDLGVIGIGIGGSELEFPPEPFEPVFREARRAGFHTNAHAGEAAGAQSIWGAVRSLHIERIGHCTRAYEDPKLRDFLLDKRIPLEMCPVSNVRTGVVKSLNEHPIRSYYEQGLIVTVNTDDPKMFGTCLADEYRLLVEECCFSMHDICSLILFGIQSSWLTDDQKKEMAENFKRDPSWLLSPQTN
jgi:adenosine deaminase